jgi:hypothetical protein
VKEETDRRRWQQRQQEAAAATTTREKVSGKRVGSRRDRALGVEVGRDNDGIARPGLYKQPRVLGLVPNGKALE